MRTKRETVVRKTEGGVFDGDPTRWKGIYVIRWNPNPPRTEKS